MISYLTPNLSSCIQSLYQFEMKDDCQAFSLIDSKTANVALAGIEFVTLALTAFHIGKTIKYLITSKKDPQMIQIFESNWKVLNPDQHYVSMNGLFTEKNCAYLQTIFQSWRLHRGLCFFDLLGAQMHRNWKKKGAREKDLKEFGALCKKLSTLGMGIAHGHNKNIAPVVHYLYKQVRILENKLPQVNAPELEILCKALLDHKKTAIIAISAVALFDGSEALEEGEASINDIVDFLDFVADMDPSLSDLVGCNNHKRLSILNSLIGKTEIALAQLQPLDFPKQIERVDRLNLLSQIKELIETRIYKVKIPFFRLFQNNYSRYASFQNNLAIADANWIESQYERFVSSNYLKRLQQILEASGLMQPNFSIKAASDIPLIFRTIAKTCNMKPPLKQLEESIIYKLNEAKKRKTNEQEYGNLFVHLVQLYQIVHDLRFVKDPSKNRLGEKLFPDSFTSLAFLCSDSNNENSITPLIPPTTTHEEPTTTTDSIICPAETLLDETFSDEASEKENSVAHILRPQKIKTRKAKDQDNDPPLLSSASTPSQPQPQLELPDFPEHPTTSQKVLNFLLRNGFFFKGASGGHYQMKHVITRITTTVPFHSGNLNPRTRNSIRDAFYQSQGINFRT